jgi:hypothetical protein
MPKAALTLLIIAVSGFDCRADYLFTWNYVYPQLQRFHGAFELTDAEMRPGAMFGSSLFYNSVSITGPEGISYRGSDPVWDNSQGGAGPPFWLSMDLHDGSHSISLSVAAVGPDNAPPDPNGPHPLAGSIFEFFPSGATVTESGWWSFQQVPEPSPATFSGIAGAIWIAWRRKR